MQLASKITVTRGTAHGSETLAFSDARCGDADRFAAARIIAGLLTALDLQGVRRGAALDVACLAAELTLEDWGFPVPGAQAAAA